MGEVVRVTLNNGVRMPVIGFGLGAEDIIISKGSSALLDYIRTSILTAIQVGYRAFDTASVYFTEGILGQSLKEVIEKGLVSREEVFVTSKLSPADCYPQDVVPALRKSLETLQLEYLDLYLIHSPLVFKKGAAHPHVTPDDVVAMDVQGVWRAMEECIELGLTRTIGVSNFSSKKISDLLALCNIPPAVNQVEMHPCWQQEKLRTYCKSENIHVSAWSPLGGTGNSWGSSNILDNHLIKGIACKHKKTPAQVALRWGIEKDVSVIPKSFKPARILDNFQVFDWKLDDEDHDKISSIGQERLCTFKNFVNPIKGPFKTIEEVWDGEL